MEHTESCKKTTARLEKAIAEYQAKWPNYCHKCNGSGNLISYQSVPYGMGDTNMEVDDFCETCLGEGKCPRCGKTVFKEDDYYSDNMTCPECGWDERSEICPELDDCGCWEIYIEFPKEDF